MPDDTAARVGIAGISLGLAGFKLANRRMDRTELLIARHFLHQPTFIRIPDSEVAHQIEQMCWPQHAGDKFLLAGQRPGCLAEFAKHVGLGNRAGVLPLGKILAGITERAGACLIEMRSDNQRVEMEQLRDTLAFGVIQFTLIGIMEKLVHRLFHRACDGRTLALNHHERETVHEQHDVRPLVVGCALDEHLELIDGEKIVFRLVSRICG